MDDYMLSFISKLTKATDRLPLEQPITLLTGGFLVSGTMISYDKYIEHHPVTKEVDRVLRESEKSKVEDLEDSLYDSLKSINFIHLKNACFWTGIGNCKVSSDNGVYVRIHISSISGFTLGEPQYYPPA